MFSTIGVPMAEINSYEGKIKHFFSTIKILNTLFWIDEIFNS